MLLCTAKSNRLSGNAGSVTEVDNSFQQANLAYENQVKALSIDGAVIVNKTSTFMKYKLQ